ncbi:MAG: rRNA maturation RNase YbeY [Prevotella sp.]|nr:rRNA maturation RNase YbeY [Prevotella sp.]
MITYNVDGVKMPPIKRRQTSKWIKKVISLYGRGVGEIGYMFVGDEKILEINQNYLGHDYYTDIITFDYNEGNKVNGDIVISLDTVRSNSEELGKDFLEELNRVIIHGILHLCGLKDKGRVDAKKMRTAEDEALSLLSSI